MEGTNKGKGKRKGTRRPGGMGRRAIEMLNADGIKVLRSKSRTVRETAEDINQGRLLEMTPHEACAGHSGRQTRSGDDAAAAYIAPGGPEDGQGVNARMTPEPLVLCGHKGRGHHLGDVALGKIDELAPLGLGGQAQDPAGPVQHQGAGVGFQGLRVEAGGGLAEEVPAESSALFS